MYTLITINNLVLSSIICVTLIYSLAFTFQPAQAQFGTGVDGVARIQSENALPDLEPPAIMLRIIKFLLGLVGLNALLVVVIGGVLYITSIGDEQKAARAKNTVLFAILGILFAGAAWMIVTAVGRIFITLP